MDLSKSYPTLVMDGSTTKQTYVRLAHLDGLGIHVALMPGSVRISEGAILIGGKLRVAYDSAYGIKGKEDLVLMSEKSAVANLKSAFPGKAPWINTNPQRLSSMVGLPIKAGIWEGQAFLQKDPLPVLVDTLFNQIEEGVGCTIEHKRTVKKCLLECYKESLPLWFMDLTHPSDKPETNADVISFADKAAAKKAKENE